MNYLAHKGIPLEMRLAASNAALAAVEAEVDLVPVFVVPLENDQERVVDQLVTNRERIDMSRADTVAAVHQLAFDLKMPADQIAKRTRIPRDQVDAAVKVAGAVAVVAALDNVEREITLDFAARIVDAELTVEETQRVVTSRFNPEQELKNVLRARELLTSIAALTAQVNATSTPLVDQPNRGSQASEFSGSDSTKNRHLWIARLADVKTDKALTEAAHASCPGHAAAIAGGGYYGGGEPTVRYLCTDPKKYGHYDMQKAKPAPPLTDEQRVAKAARVELERQWPDVVETRRTFLRVVLQRPKLPEGWEILTALIETEAIRAGNWNSPRFDSPALAFDLLGHAIPGTTGQGEHVRTLLAKNPKLAPKLLLARALAYVETGISTKKDLDTTPPEYLEQLVAWGYELTEAEAALAKGR